MISPGSWFSTATGHASWRPWQARLIEDGSCRSQVVRIPTGLGKTQGVLAAWAWNRCVRKDADWPRRLVWCLPMRVLTEQVVAEARDFLRRAGLSEQVEVHALMGGVDAGDWFLKPEREAVLVGTQDMLLSRALNRGYATPRARWPMEFGLVSQDSLWIFDEVQLMDVGLATSAQLQAFRDDELEKQMRPVRSWWMSATLQTGWLRSVDTVSHHGSWIRKPRTLKPEELTQDLCNVPKSIEVLSFRAKEDREFAAAILDRHQSGTITLVVCNTVDRARQTHDALVEAGRSQGLNLIHSRFRPEERKQWRDAFLSRGACTEGVDRMIVSTQVVEAGVDLSAELLVTELAPWPSLVQRFGRCARYGGKGRVLVVDRGRDENLALPYSVEELEAAWSALDGLDDVGISGLESFEHSLPEIRRGTLYPYSPRQLLQRRDYDELFDTTTDLTGADLDISRFIRSGEERDLQVFWLELGKDEEPRPVDQPRSEDLCSVPFLAAQDWLCGPNSKGSPRSQLKKSQRAWVWDWIDGEWVGAERSALLPGRIVCVDAKCGGYDPLRGFDPQSKEIVVVPEHSELDPESLRIALADDQQDGETLSLAAYKTIALHGEEAAHEAHRLGTALRLPSDLAHIVTLAAQWHDLGKAHPAFQSLIRERAGIERSDLAKAPPGAWGRKYYCDDGERRGFRHELASALALFALVERHEPMHSALLGPWRETMTQLGHELPDAAAGRDPSECEREILALGADDFDLLVYLVASHHGKVRVSLAASSTDHKFRDRDGRGLPIRGVRQGDTLPATAITPGELPLPELSLGLEPAQLGLSPRYGRSWRERTLALQGRFGPATLAYLEALVIAADRLASRLATSDPALTEVAMR